MKEFREFSYKVDELGITPEAVEHFIGYEPGGSPEPVRRLIEDSLAEARGYCDIRGAFLLAGPAAFDGERRTLSLGGAEFDVRKIIFGQLRRSESAAVFICTAGSGIGRRSEELMRSGHELEGYILDAVGSEIVEAAMDRAQDELERDLATRGLGITDRFSPGYCGWSVGEQQKLFGLFGSRFPHVTLTERSLMDPIKSVSGLIGIGREVSRKGYPCHACDADNCIYRKKA